MKMKVLRLMGVALAVVALVNMMLFTHQRLSYAEALNEMVRCESQGGIACHIERDGLDYGVYSW